MTTLAAKTVVEVRLVALDSHDLQIKQSTMVDETALWVSCVGGDFGGWEGERMIN